MSLVFQTNCPVIAKVYKEMLKILPNYSDLSPNEIAMLPKGFFSS